MHCHECGKTIEVTAGETEIPVYDYTRRSYYFQKATVIECPHCQELIAITNYEKGDIKIDESLQIEN